MRSTAVSLTFSLVLFLTHSLSHTRSHVHTQMKLSRPMEESWQIDIRDIQVKKRVGFGSYAEVSCLAFFRAYTCIRPILSLASMRRSIKDGGKASMWRSRSFSLASQGEKRRCGSPLPMAAISLLSSTFLSLKYARLTDSSHSFSLPPSLSPQLLSAFHSEIDLMSKFHHRNIITFYGASCDPPNLCIITEWMGKGR